MESTKQYKTWVCKDCGHEVLAVDYPYPIPWEDGHKCKFVSQEEKREEDSVKLESKVIEEQRIKKQLKVMVAESMQNFNKQRNALVKKSC